MEDRDTTIFVILDPHSFTPNYVPRGITHRIGRCDEALYVTTREVTSSDLKRLRKRFHSKLKIASIPGSCDHKAAFERVKSLVQELCYRHNIVNICWDEMAESNAEPNAELNAELKAEPKPRS